MFDVHTDKAGLGRKEGTLQKMRVREGNGWMELPKYTEARSEPQGNEWRPEAAYPHTRRIRIFILKRSTLHCNWAPVRGEESL